MKTLVLLRHGKSSRDNPDHADHERPLAPRGRRAAEEMGRLLGARGLLPDLILCSSARRAVETLERALSQWGAAAKVPVEREHGLYLCGRKMLVDRLHDVSDGVGTALLVGHNPDLHDLALFLTGSGDPLALAAIRQKFPTGAVAVLELGKLRWREIDAGTGLLVAFEVPSRPVRKEG